METCWVVTSSSWLFEPMQLLMHLQASGKVHTFVLCITLRHAHTRMVYVYILYILKIVLCDPLDRWVICNTNYRLLLLMHHI